MNAVSAESNAALRLATFAAFSGFPTPFAARLRFALLATRLPFAQLTPTARQLHAAAVSLDAAYWAEAGACIAADCSADSAAREAAGRGKTEQGLGRGRNAECGMRN
jgi:hypothetical protein